MTLSIATDLTRIRADRHSFESAQDAARRTRASDSINARMPTITRQLGEAGVTRVYMKYASAQGQRYLQKLRYLDADDQLTVPALRPDCRARLIQFIYDLIDARFPSWGISLGVSGHFIWDLAIDIVVQVQASQLIESEVSSTFKL